MTDYADAHVRLAPRPQSVALWGWRLRRLFCQGEGAPKTTGAKSREDTVLEIQLDHMNQKPLIFID